MAATLEAVRDFAVQIEKTLAARRLYQPANTAFRNATEMLHQRCRAAAANDGFTLGVTATDLMLGKTSVLHRPKTDDSFFFPLYRDGLRELTFDAHVEAADVEKLVALLEVKEKDLAPGEDMVSLLWNADLATISHSAIDGIGDVESGDAAGDELHGLIAELAAKIKNPAPASQGQSYTFMLDADLRVPATDFHYDANTVRRRFEDNPAVLRLTGDEVSEIRSELGPERDRLLVERFIEILLTIARSPSRTVDPAVITPIFQQIAERYWTARDYNRVAAILIQVHAAALEAPTPESRAKLADVVARFVTPERLNIIVLDFIGGALPSDIAMSFWGFAADDVIWPILLDTWSHLPEGESRNLVLGVLRKRMAANLELLRRTLGAPEPTRVRAALSLLDERTERVFAIDLLALTTHADENIRLKGLAAATRLGGAAAREALWKAMESDPSKSVRLYAFRAISVAHWPELAARLQALVTDPQFADRPAWEREKYVRLLGSIGGNSVEELFESWIPSKRWRWQAKDLEQLEIALCGLAATGPDGLQKVRAIEESGGKPADVARKVLAALPRAEMAGRS